MQRKFIISLIGVMHMVFCWSQKAELVVQKGHFAPIYSAAFSPDGKFVVTGGLGESVKLWTINGQELQSFRTAESVRSICFSPDGEYILMAGDTARIIDLTGKEIRIFHHKLKGEFRFMRDNIHSVAYSPTEQHVLTRSAEGTVKLWDLSDRKSTGLELCDDATSICFSPDGKRVVTGHRNDVAILWDLNGDIDNILVGHDNPVTFVDYSKDDKYYLTASEDGTTKLWDWAGGELRTFNGHKRRINSAFFSPDSRYILTASDDGTAKLWTLSGQEIQSFKGHNNKVKFAGFSPDGRLILTAGSDGSAILWTRNGRQLNTFQGSSRQIQSVSFSPDGKKLLAGNSAGIFSLWNLTGQGPVIYSTDVKTVAPGRMVNFSIQFSPDGEQILSCGDDMKLWDLHGREIQTFPYEKSEIHSCYFSPDGKQMFMELENTGYGTGTKLLDSVGREIRSFEWGSIYGFSPDGKYVLTSNVNGYSAELWDLQGRKILSFAEHEDYVNSGCFSPDGQQVLTGSRDGTAKLWTLSGREISTIKSSKYRGYTKHDRLPVIEVGFSPDGKRIVTNNVQEVKIWSSSGKELISLPNFHSRFRSTCFSPDGRQVLVGNSDGTVRLLDSSTGALIFTFYTLSREQWLLVNADNYYMGANKIFDFIHFKIDLQAYSFDQFDLRLNRPDKVLETMLPFGLDSSLINQYRRAYHKRLEKYGFTEEMLSDDYNVPHCILKKQDQIPITTRDSVIEIEIEATDSLRLLDRLNVFVNNVPIYGIQGINLRDKNTRQYIAPLRISLSPGQNKIQISVLNQAGAESLKTTTFVTFDTMEDISDLYLITIGVSDYQADGKDLQFAAKDAKDIKKLFESAEGFNRVFTKTLTDLQVTKDSILALKDWLRMTKVNDQVMIYVSGHGLLDENYDFYYGTHDIDFVRPAKKGILYDDIEGLLDGIPARKKLLLMDACHSGEFDKDISLLSQAKKDSLEKKSITFRGFSKGEEERTPILGLQNSFEMMQQLFADLRRRSGATVITSSSGIQVSYEGEEWANGVFTYVFLYGLKTMNADTNQDGKITASEIQAYVAKKVPRLTEGLQVPTFRQENLEYDFRVW